MEREGVPTGDALPTSDPLAPHSPVLTRITGNRLQLIGAASSTPYYADARLVETINAHDVIIAALDLFLFVACLRGTTTNDTCRCATSPVTSTTASTVSTACSTCKAAAASSCNTGLAASFSRATRTSATGTRRALTSGTDHARTLCGTGTSPPATGSARTTGSASPATSTHSARTGGT